MHPQSVPARDCLFSFVPYFLTDVSACRDAVAAAAARLGPAYTNPWWRDGEPALIRGDVPLDWEQAQWARKTLVGT